VPSQSSFRTQQPNTLERDFQAHQQQQFDPIFANAFQGPSRMQQQLHQQQPLQHQQTKMGSSSWANDFKMTNMAPRQQQQQLQPQAARSDWNTQFMNQMNVQQTQQQHFQPQYQQSFTPQMQSNFALGTGQMIEHRELHQQYLNSQLSHDLDHDELERQFESLEKQFQKVEMKEPEPPVELPTNNNAGFRDAAKQVADVMKSANSEKFANSKFLDLMTRVTAGQVELNEDETKLVDEQGRDIHEEQLKDSGSVQQQKNPLPDPLKFVQNGELETPFQSARLVGKSLGERYTWDDVYDDYRNDDTSF
jgi:hypothetical protein